MDMARFEIWWPCYEIFEGRLKGKRTRGRMTWWRRIQPPFIE